MLPFADVFAANGSSDRPVLLSERSQLIAIKALQIAEFRAAWDEMSDENWDDLHAAISEAEYEILEMQVPYSPQVIEVSRTTLQQPPANTPTAVIWNDGGFDASFPTQLTNVVNGIVSISASLQVQSLSTPVVKLIVRRHDGVYMAVASNGNAAAEHNLSVSYVGQASVGDFFEIVVLATTNCTITVTQNLPRAGMIGLPTS